MKIWKVTYWEKNWAKYYGGCNDYYDLEDKFFTTKGKAEKWAADNNIQVKAITEVEVE